MSWLGGNRVLGFFMLCCGPAWPAYGIECSVTGVLASVHLPCKPSVTMRYLAGPLVLLPVVGVVCFWVLW